MNLVELKEAVKSSIEHAIECGVSPEDVDVSLQIDTSGKGDVACSGDVEAHYDNDCQASGFVMVGTKGYEA